MFSSAEEFKKIQPEEYFRHFIEKGKRCDGREDLESLRKTRLTSGTISTADGSAIVKQGETIVCCGITLDFAPPKAEEPKKGFLVPNVDLPPMCHARFRPGNNSDEAFTASQFIYEVLTNCEFIDLEKLCIREGKLAWVVSVDMTCLNYDGNILDCSLKALVAAFKNLRFPTVIINEDDDEVIAKDIKECIEVDIENKTPMELNAFPVALTIGIYENKLLVDPTDEEEKFISGSVTIVLDSKTNEFCHFKKGGGDPITQEQLQKCIDLTKKLSKDVQILIEGSIDETFEGAPSETFDDTS